MFMVIHWKCKQYMLHINGLISMFYWRLFVFALFEMAQCDTSLHHDEFDCDWQLYCESGFPLFVWPPVYRGLVGTSDRWLDWTGTLPPDGWAANINYYSNLLYTFLKGNIRWKNKYKYCNLFFLWYNTRDNKYGHFWVLWERILLFFSASLHC